MEPDLESDPEFQELKRSVGKLVGERCSGWSDCYSCRHLFPSSRSGPGEKRCRAFPGRRGIPGQIWNGLIRHDVPYPGDHGIVFERLAIIAVVEAPDGRTAELLNNHLWVSDDTPLALELQKRFPVPFEAAESEVARQVAEAAAWLASQTGGSASPAGPTSGGSGG